MADAIIKLTKQTIKVALRGAQGPRGLASGPLGVGSVGADEVSEDGGEQALIRAKIGAVSGTSFSGTPKDFGATADGVADDRPAIMAAQAEYGVLNLPPLPDGSTYRMETASAADFTAPINAEDGVILSLPSSQDGSAPIYGTMAAMKFRTATDVLFRNESVPNRFGPDPDPWLKPLPGLLSSLRKFKATALGGAGVAVRYIAYPGGGDTWANVTPDSTTASDVTFLTPNGFNAAFTDLAVGETLRQSFKTIPAGVTATGYVIRGTNGYVAIYNPIGSDGLGYIVTKEAGETAVLAQTLDWPNRGVNETFRFENAEWSITRTGPASSLLKMNGVGIGISGQVYPEIGDIQEVGIALYAEGAYTVTLSGHVIEQSDELLGMPRCSTGVIFGDSTAEDMASCWVRDLPALMDGFQGIQLGPIDNRAVASTDLADAYAAMQVSGALGASNWVGVSTGTNDIQGQTDRATFSTTFANMCEYITVTRGKLMVCVLPYLWYGLANSGGSGSDAVNEEQGAWYRSEMMRICATYGVVYIDPANYLGNPDPTQRLQPKGGGQLRDNIHQTSKGHQPYALAFARATLSEYCKLPDSYSSLIWPNALFAGTTQVSGVPMGYDFGGDRARLYGLVDVTTITNGTQIMTLPRHLRPDRTIRQRVLAFDAGSAPLAGNPYVNIDGPDGDHGAVILQGAPVGTTRLDLADITIPIA